MSIVKEPKVVFIMGSDSNLSNFNAGVKILEDFGVDSEVIKWENYYAPDRAADFAKRAEENGAEVIIVSGGKSAHLPGSIAVYTVLPVIGVPGKISAMDGLDSLLSTVQTPEGIPVATVAIDGAENAALLAIQILSVSNEDLREKMKEYKAGLEKMVAEKNASLQEQLKKI